VHFFLEGSAKTMFLIFIALWVGPTLIRFATPLPLPVSKVVDPLFILFPLVWAWSIGINFHRLVPRSAFMSLSSFKVAFGFAVISLYAWFLFFFGPMRQTLTSLLVFSVMDLAAIYVVYFAARTIVMLDGSKAPTFNNVGKVFLLICLFPVGVRFIQPRVNRILRAV
jgi:hypothetical protein